MALENVSIFTQALNTAFINAYDAIAEPAPIEAWMTRVPSHGRAENLAWMYPPPLLHIWKGFRQYAKLGTTDYRVPNVTYTAEFEVTLEDLNDDQVNGYKIQAAAMAEGAKIYPGIQVLQTLALGQSTPCYDGSNFFASSHNIGTINNIVPGTAAGTDGQTHAMVVMVQSSKLVKPLLWQEREIPALRTDAGTELSEQNRVVKWYTAMRGAALFGFPWDAVLVKWTNTPTVAEVQTTLTAVNSRLRQFTYPKNLPSDVNQYIHGQKKFNDKNVSIVCSTLIENVVRQALTMSLINASENYFKEWADLICSGYLDSVV